jgi:hypothetical protein
VMSDSIAYTGVAAGELPFSLQWYVCRGQITSPGAATMPAVLQSQGATSLPPPRVQTASAESIWPSPRRVSPDPKAALTTTWLWLAPVVHASAGAAPLHAWRGPCFCPYMLKGFLQVTRGGQGNKCRSCLSRACLNPRGLLLYGWNEEKLNDLFFESDVMVTQYINACCSM